MKIKRTDLELFMKYIEKEKPETVDIHVENFSTTFSFADAEHRDCMIRLFESSANTTPELNKKMKLYTRFKETKKQGDDNE